MFNFPRLCALAVLLGARCVFAHDPGLSSANVGMSANRIDVVLTFNERDIAAAAGIAPEVLNENAKVPPAITGLLPRVALLTSDHQMLTPQTSSARIDSNHNVDLHLTYASPKGGREFEFRSLLLKDLPFGHRQAFAVRESTGHELARAIFSASSNTATFASSAGTNSPPASHSFEEFLLLGIRHILTGYDHLLFLFGLLIMCRKVRTAALLITCFTAAHSLTLALSTFGLVNLPSRFVEAAIAASILYVGVENLLRPEQRIRGRALLTFTFGLVHGLGFASVLREMGVANTGAAAAIPLLAFNGGVEVGQLSVAAVLLPLIWFLRRSEALVRFAIPACSIAVALAGGYWLLERTVF